MASGFRSDVNAISHNGYRLFGELWSLMDPDTSMITHESGACRDIQCVFYD